MLSSDIIIVGAGINGCASAYQLAREGHQVTVIERFSPAAMASGWTLAGVRQSGRHPAELPVAIEAVKMWPKLSEELGADTGYRQEGNLRLARDENEVETIQDLVKAQSKAGLDVIFLDGSAEIHEIAPAISPKVLAASFCRTDGHAEPHATVMAFRAAAERHGARFFLGQAASEILVDHDKFVGISTGKDRIVGSVCVVAAGIHSNDLLAPLGLSIPLSIPMVTVIQTEPLQPLLKPVFGVANANCAGRQQIDGRLRVTSSAMDWHGELVQGPPPAVAPTASSIARTIENVSGVLPALGEAKIAKIWAGLLDLTPDALPVIERTPEIDGIVIAAGFSGHGFGIGPMTSLLVRDLVLNETPRLPLNAFQRSRFQDQEVKQSSLTLHG
jgi:sarcosine oxidase, subunit beta